MRPTLTCLLLANLSLTPTMGIINTTVPLGNTVAPTGTAGEPTDPGFDHVGRVNGSTGVYLGNGWVMIGSGRSPTSASTTTWFVDTDPG